MCEFCAKDGTCKLIFVRCYSNMDLSFGPYVIWAGPDMAHRNL